MCDERWTLKLSYNNSLLNVTSARWFGLRKATNWWLGRRNRCRVRDLHGRLFTPYAVLPSVPTSRRCVFSSFGYIFAVYMKANNKHSAIELLDTLLAYFKCLLNFLLLFTRYLSSPLFALHFLDVECCKFILLKNRRPTRFISNFPKSEWRVPINVCVYQNVVSFV